MAVPDGSSSPRWSDKPLSVHNLVEKLSQAGRSFSRSLVAQTEESGLDWGGKGEKDGVRMEPWLLAGIIWAM